ncbi:hypothetical protein DVH05_017800 [Phytophthora capsici]|nr:hypothetical protein DVH05_017800 [Phytophthora capsici]
MVNSVKPSLIQNTALSGNKELTNIEGDEEERKEEGAEVAEGTLVYIAGTDLLPGVLRVKSVGQFVANLLMFDISVDALALTTLHHVHCDAS